jgi:hypothetical protein
MDKWTGGHSEFIEGWCLSQIVKMTLDWIFVEQCFPTNHTENTQSVFSHYISPPIHGASSVFLKWLFPFS